MVGGGDKKSKMHGGEGGIRTRGKVTPTHAFQACSFNHSDTSPISAVNRLRMTLRRVDCIKKFGPSHHNFLWGRTEGVPGTELGRLFSRLSGLGLGSSAVRRAAALHLPIYIFAQLNIFEAAFASHGFTRSLFSRIP